MASGQVWFRTIKHENIRAWAASRSAKPARVQGTSDALKLKIGEDEKSWEEISWEDWLAVFDEKEQAFVYEKFGFSCKIVRRNGNEDLAPGASPSTDASH
ncbi:MAG: hypothetical protein Q8Q09_15590 [Deltaproteobacteria bacterium]|nr:hypothetical protein [Deltaproteobacteria bacterium]